MTLAIEDEAVVLKGTSQGTADAGADFDGLFAAAGLGTDAAAFVLFCDDEGAAAAGARHWVLLAWVPDACRPKDKMLYSSSRDSTKRQLGAGLFGQVCGGGAPVFSSFFNCMSTPPPTPHLLFSIFKVPPQDFRHRKGAVKALRWQPDTPLVLHFEFLGVLPWGTQDYYCNEPTDLSWAAYQKSTKDVGGGPLSEVRWKEMKGRHWGQWGAYWAVLVWGGSSLGW